MNHRPSLHDPEALLRCHEPEVVLRYYAENPQMLVFDPDDDDDNRPAAHWELKATAHLCLGDLPAALESLNRAEAIRKIDDPPDDVYKHRLWSVVQFLMKNTAEAIKHHKSVVIGTRDGDIKWTGRWRGALDALDLMYYSRDPEDFTLARSFLWQLQKQNRRTPGPIALHVMGELSQQDMLKQLLSVSGWEEAKVIASSLVSSVPGIPVIVLNTTDPPRNSHDFRWNLENAAFYSALACRINGDEEGQRELMMFCANIEPTYQTASFLSRHEVGCSFRWIRQTANPQ